MTCFSASCCTVNIFYIFFIQLHGFFYCNTGDLCGANEAEYFTKSGTGIVRTALLSMFRVYAPLIWSSILGSYDSMCSYSK